MANSSGEPSRQPTVSKDEESDAEEVIEADGEATTEDSAALADPTSTSLKKKIAKKMKKKTGDGASKEALSGAKVTPQVVDQLLELNPALKGELAGMDKGKAAEAIKKMDISELLTGMAMNSKSTKDMSSYKFWQTQPVTRFDEKPTPEQSGPISIIKVEDVRKDPYPLPKGYEWSTLDLENDGEVKELYELLTLHYVEDDDAKFRFKYSQPFLNW